MVKEVPAGRREKLAEFTQQMPLKLKWKEILAYDFYVAYSAEARQDLRDIYEYIAYELLVPETAAGQWLHCSER